MYLFSSRHGFISVSVTGVPFINFACICVDCFRERKVILDQEVILGYQDGLGEMVKMD